MTIANAPGYAIPADFVGREAAGKGCVAEFAKDERSSGLLVLATEHEYAGGKPLIHHRRDELPAAEAVDQMLSRDWGANKYPAVYKRTLALVAAEGLPDRMTEANDYLRGVTNASNAFPSGL